VRIRKAIMTAAGQSQRSLPLQRLVDRDGISKTALQIILEEAGSAGCEEICIVVFPGDEDSFRAAAGNLASRLQFVTQSQPRGYGHALHCAHAFAGDEPFLHLVSDHLYVSANAQRCAQQLVAIAEAESCAVSAVQPTRETMLPYYGTVGGHRVPQRKNLYEIDTVAEKPTPTEAEQTLIVPGLRAGHYLCFFGMHVLTPALMDILAEEVSRPANSNIQLSSALTKLAERERYLALEVAGQRYDIDGKYGLLTAQLALALAGNDRAEVLSHLVEMVATQPKP